MSRSVRNRMVVVMVLLAALASLALPAVAREPVPAGTVAVSGEAAATATETVPVTDLPVAGHGYATTSDALALRHTLVTMLVLLAAAVMALGGIGLLWRYERR